MKITHVLIFAALLALTCAQKAQLILDTDPKEQLLTACQTGEKTEVVMALTNGADINAKDMGDLTALHYSAQKGHESITRVLIEDGGRVNALSIDKTTPLMLAVEYAHEKVVELLLRKGANMHIVDKSGADALHRAAFISNPEAPAILKLLLDQSTENVDRADYEGKTPIALACERGNWEAVGMLAKAGASPNQRVGDNDDGNGPTPLMIAAMHGQAETVKTLLDAGASVHALDGQWNGVLTYAQYGQKQRVNPRGDAASEGADFETTIELLLQYGAFYDDVKIRMVRRATCAREQYFLSVETSLTPTHLHIVFDISRRRQHSARSWF
eukprot:INCI3726.2.p1 GENE.INCI3726.2~~INCI3726.2.p1  ORF type:complete len:328 (+),score=66.16 INCI3726.2:96-1079(+)